MTVTVRSGFLLLCGLMAPAFGIDCVPCAHAEVYGSLALTSFAQRGGQTKHQPVALPANTPGQYVCSPSLSRAERTTLEVRSAAPSRPETYITALGAQLFPQTTDAPASSSMTTPPKAATVNLKILDPTSDDHYNANETISSGPSSSPLFSNKDGAANSTLPDAPAPQEQKPSAPQPAVSGPQINQLSVLPPKLTSYQLDASDKLYIYVHDAYGPPAVVLPAFGVGFGMINPKRAYPKEWKDGAGAFGRRYGDAIARDTSKSTAEFMTGTILHEDPRYSRSKRTGALGRTFHALAFTFFDKTDSEKTTLAVSHFAGAAADGFVGMAYLPAGFNDLTHAGQRSVASLGTAAIGNILNEFEPEWGPVYQKLHIPKILPIWWVPEHR